MTGDFRFSHRWHDMAADAERKRGGWFDRSVVDRLEQRDLEIEDKLQGGGLDTFIGTTGSWTANETTITVTLPAATIGYTYYFRLTGGTSGGIITVFTDSTSGSFPVDNEGVGGLPMTVLTGRTGGGELSIPVRRYNTAGVLALVGGAV